ncbi:MAG: DAK2 domain-containing protein [Lachnospiraceae bacterium]|nr:DAK2 domain-containing protein [Lachnospiraceae bacterium]
MDTNKINAKIYQNMIMAGTEELAANSQEVNDLNVFPIPDGDTGSNMTLTMKGGAKADISEDMGLAKASKSVANGMLLAARGNSGVILSQFFAGVAEGFANVETADVDILKEAFLQGVKRAYSSVLTPTEGTILTVAKDAANYASSKECRDTEEYFNYFIEEAKKSLERTPELLKVLKDAGVVDSGGAGFIYIIAGMIKGLTGKVVDLKLETTVAVGDEPSEELNVDMFTEDMEMEFGYCTELLIRLQKSKVNIDEFDVKEITDYLTDMGGDSIVCLKNDSIVKLHVHTMTPYMVLQHCQKYGEFLKVKVENMMLQHNEATEVRPESAAGKTTKKPRTKYAVVTVASGEGIAEAFTDFGAYVINGGQTMNPSTADFLEAFDELNAEHIFVLPNNGNIIMAANQAAGIYEKSKVYVIPTKTIGDGYGVLSMLSFDSDDPKEIEEQMNEAFTDVMTIEISKAIRDCVSGSLQIKEGDYMGILGKDILATGQTPVEAAIATLENVDLIDHYLIMIVRGKQGTREGSTQILDYVRKNFPMVEVYETDGLQDIYDYYIVLE